MKGVVFNLLEEVVCKAHGDAVWDMLLDKAGLDGSYTSLGSYPDEHAHKLVFAAAEALNVSPTDVLVWFGREAMPVLADKYPAFFNGHNATKPFLLTLNSIIHPEVRKVYPGADVPVFDFENGPHGELLMGYRSGRRLCALAQGFVEGAAGHFGEHVHFEHLQCMHKGDEKCQFRISFGAAH